MWKEVKSSLRRGLLVLTALASAASTAHALTINLSYDPSVAADFGANTASLTSAMTYVVQQFQNNFSDNITLSIAVSAAPSNNTAVLGESSTNLIGTTYSNLVTAFTSHQSTTNDAAAYSSLPATSPLPEAIYVLPTAEAKAMGLPSGNPATDGTVIFGAAYGYTFDPNNRAVPGEYDFIGIAEHELSEAMGRIYGLSEQIGNGIYLPYDLFRFSSSGTRSMTKGSGIYFSLDNGATNLSTFNPGGNGSDPQDWAGTVSDAFNAYGIPSVKNDMTAVDLAVMDVLGFHLIPTNKWTWAANASGNWSGSGSWINYGVPSGSGIQVVFDGAINAPRTITLDVSPTAGTLTFDNANSYTLSGSGLLTLATTQGDAVIQVLSGSHSISANMTLSSNTDVIVSGTGSLLTLSGSLGGPGGLIKSDSGKLILSGTANSFNGGTTVLGGKLIVTNLGALQDGSNLSVGVNTALFHEAIVPGSMMPPVAESEPATVPEPTTTALVMTALGITLVRRLHYGIDRSICLRRPQATAAPESERANPAPRGRAA